MVVSDVRAEWWPSTMHAATAHSHSWRQLFTLVATSLAMRPLCASARTSRYRYLCIENVIPVDLDNIHVDRGLRDIDYETCTRVSRSSFFIVYIL